MNEKDLIRLVEDRGVGIYPFKKVIDEIVNYVQNYLLDTKYNPDFFTVKINKHPMEVRKFKIEVPTNITKKLDFVTNFTISVMVYDLEDSESIIYVTGGNGTSQDYYDQRVNSDGKLNFGSMTLQCFSHKKELYPRTIYEVLYHEFNHAWESYQRLKNGKQSSYDALLSGDYQHVTSNLKKTQDVDIKSLYMIVYRLFFKAEFNALVASVYGDLKLTNGKQFSNDIKTAKAFQIYKEIKDNVLPRVKEMPDYKWGIFFDEWRGKPSNYVLKDKQTFINKTEFLLDQLFRRIAKTASLYYEEKSIGEYTFNENSGIETLIMMAEPLKYRFDEKLKEIEQIDRMKTLMVY
jgi:hypothetical protein